MKRRFLHALLLATAVFGFSSCSDDDDGPSNNFTYDGTTRGIVGVGELIIDDSPGEGENGTDIYFHQLTLLSAELSANTKTISGVNIGFTSHTSDVTAGTYTFTGSDNSGKDLELYYGTISIDYDLTTGDGKSYDFVTGTATVKVSGETYTIDAEGTASTDGTATGAKAFKIHYSGKLDKTTP